MCGLVGFFDPRQQLSNVEAEQRLIAMSDLLRHRGPDAEGVAVEQNEASTAWGGLGHRRLSILDLSPNGAQPMRSHCGRYLIAFNGEIYNFRSLRRFLDRRERIHWRGTSDTEVLLELIAQVGVEKALARLDGMFAFALLDRENRQLTLARDAFGEKPLYYGLWKGVLLFASELRAMAAWPGFRPRENQTARTAFFRYSYVPAPETIYERVWKLPAAHWLQVGFEQLAVGNLPVTRAWWDPVDAAIRSMQSPFEGDFESAVDAVDQAMRRSIRRRMVADVPVGSLLSGGIDSSLTTAIMQEISDSPVRTFTIGMAAEGYDESPAAEIVAKHLGTRHETLMLTAEDVLAVVPEISRMYDEPFADSSQIPTFLVSRMAREHVTVGLSGDGGDELFAGYNRHFRTPWLWNRLRRFPLPARSLIARAIRALPPGSVNRTIQGIGRLAPAELAAGRGGEKLHKLARVLGANSWEHLHELLLRTGPATDEHEGDPAFPSITARLDPRVAVLGMAERLMLFDTANYLPDDILTKVDRASMAVGLELRTPYLDRELFSLAWSLPMSMKANDRKGKLVLRSLLHRYVPRELVDRNKAGFAVPIGLWMRGPLQSWLTDTIYQQKDRLEEFLSFEAMKELLSDHVKGMKNNESELWKIAVYLTWSSRNSNPESPPVRNE